MVAKDEGQARAGARPLPAKTYGVLEEGNEIGEAQKRIKERASPRAKKNENGVSAPGVVKMGDISACG